MGESHSIGQRPTAWARDTSLSGSYFGIAASGPGAAWAVGSNGVAQRWDGTSWVPVPALTAYALNAVWSVGRNDVRAVGMSRTILRGH